MRKIENELRVATPVLYKNDMLQANFAEALRVLYVSTKPLHSLLSATISSDDLERVHLFTEQLMLTGFSGEAQEIIESFAYKNRKANASKADDLQRYFEKERVQLERVVNELKSKEFAKMDVVIDNLKQLSDICKYNYVTPLRLFDPAFNPSSASAAQFNAIPLDLIESSLLDLYYVTANMDITTSTSNAVRALYQLYHRDAVDPEQEVELANCMRKIQGVLKNVFTSDLLLKLIRLAKGNPEFKPDVASYNSSERQRYAEFLESRFVIDEGRLKNELQDENISNEVNSLFGGAKLERVKGYNNEVNEKLKASTPCSFFWVLPMEVLKNFIKQFYESHVKPLLNDIIIEGFFNVAEFKSDFSSAVYAVNDTLAHIEQFELKFNQSAVFDENLVTGMIQDSHKDNAFMMRLKELVDKINKEAKNVLQNEVNNLYDLNGKLGELLVEFRKPTSDSITNLKVLMLSSRNRDNSAFLDKSYDSWKIFFDIMKEYVTIKSEKKK